MSRADKVALADVEPDAVILIPLFATTGQPRCRPNDLHQAGRPPSASGHFRHMRGVLGGAGDRDYFQLLALFFSLSLP